MRNYRNQKLQRKTAELDVEREAVERSGRKPRVKAEPARQPTSDGPDMSELIREMSQARRDQILNRMNKGGVK